jgi:2-polyprenyl-6-methoxyphenol hydroxylase-like FAD-dependent oxidoreductase
MATVVIVGGGLGGLLAVLQLAKQGIPVTLFERKRYPFHRVCGEYISNETAPFLRSLGVYPNVFQPPVIRELQLTSVNGRAVTLPLDLGGFGISRFAFDAFLVQHVKAAGATVKEQSEVTQVTFNGQGFDVMAEGKPWSADMANGRASIQRSTARFSESVRLMWGSNITFAMISPAIAFRCIISKTDIVASARLKTVKAIYVIWCTVMQ